jgi:hypothetical protein
MVTRGDHWLSDRRKPLTFQVGYLKILSRWDWFENLNRNILRPIAAKENGTANSQALLRVA